MSITRSFASNHLSQSQFRLAPITLGATIWLFLSSFFLMHIPVQATHLQTTASTHGCAPNTPPPVSGTTIPAPAISGSVMINEVLSNPKSTWNCSDPAGDFSPSTDSWIELYNTQSQTLNLYASHAEISLDGGTNWYRLPFGSEIVPNGWLVIFPLEGLTTPPSPTWNMVFAVGNTTIDQATIPTLLADQSYARVPDGSINWQSVGQPTIDASNNASGQPVTATPTKIPKPTQTAKPTRATSSPGDPKATPSTYTGTQPAGNQLQIPPNPTSGTRLSATATTSILTQNTPATPSTTSDAWHMFTLISLLLLFCGSLVWCWWLFRSP